MDTVIEARGLGKRYRGSWALSDCTLSMPAGHVVGLVGPNGAGKTTLLNLAVGLLAPTTGTIEVLGDRPASSAAQLAKVGYVAQDPPIYAALSIAEHLTYGAHLNATWDGRYAANRIAQLGLDPGQRAGKLSGGQRAQVALTLAIAKRPELLILDEPVASLDPLARRDFLNDLIDAVTDHQMSVVLSSHLVTNLQRVCDHLIVLSGGRIQISGEISHLLATHQILTSDTFPPTPTGRDWHVITTEHTDTHTTLVLHADHPIRDPAWTPTPISLEDLVLAYMRQSARAYLGHHRTPREQK
jgi:ABC-2 type transport system ATP-binding protein